MIRQFVYCVDRLSRAIGHAFAWSALMLMAGTVYEVFTRYVLNDATSWAFDFSYICYGALFFMAGAYLQGAAEMLRCILCLRENAWPPRLHHVEELEKKLMEEHAGGVPIQPALPGTSS